MYKIGVDLGGTNIAVGLINDNYEIIARAGTKTNIPRPAEEIFADNQPEAIRTFKRYNPCCEIIAITILEEGR